jgi:Domain of unknown function (DUF4258)
MVKKIHFSQHALTQCEERGAEKEEVENAIRSGTKENTRGSRYMYKMNFQFNSNWNGKYYSVKQVAPVVKENHEIIVITVYTFYF